MKILFWLAPFFLFPLVCLPADRLTTYSITVKAGDFDRISTPVSFRLPDDAGEAGALRGPGDEMIPLQPDGKGNVHFLTETMRKGEERIYLLLPKPVSPLEVVKAEFKEGVLRISSGNKAILQYQAERSELPRDNIKPGFRRGGYLHPVYSPSGLVVTDDYPANHIHHHGIWFAWTKTEFQGRAPDFWNMGDAKGTIEFVALDAHWSGPVHAGFRSRHRFVDLTAAEPKAALNEAWHVTVYRGSAREKPFWLFDFVSEQQCATEDPLKLPENRYGGIGFRGHWDWNGPNNTSFLTANGETNRVKGHATRARWCHIGGRVGDKLTGIAVLGHPDNFRAPEPMRIHPTEPFFNFAPQQAGDMSIEPGQTYTARYRFVVQDGPPSAEQIDRLWHDYAHPPRVEVKAVKP